MKIAIAGYGIEGRASFKYWNQPENQLSVVDERLQIDDLPEGVPTILGPGAFSKLQDFDLVIRTAGLNPKKINFSGQIWSATNEFFKRCPAPIIGVTGTKGKGTTSSLIASILNSGGKTVHLLGNIGQPALEILPQITPNDLVVYELSSFQLWDLKKSPHTAVVLMIEPEHLDVHASVEDYVNAKANITLFQNQNDRLIFLPTNQFSSAIAAKSKVQKIPYTQKPGAFVKDDYFWFSDQKLCPISVLKLPGRHNLDNACAAIAAAYDFVKDPEVIAHGLEQFEGLPHRLKFVKELDGVKFYDDSYATTPGSAIAAIKAFNEPEVLILGGSDKGVEFDSLAQVAADANNLKKILCIGLIGPKIGGALESAGFKNYEIVQTKDIFEIVEQAYKLAKPGGVVILSPAAASFDMFKNYSERGDKFSSAVNQLQADF